jgi:hypothetical protein
VATNTFSTQRGPIFNMRPPTSYTWMLPTLPDNRYGSRDNTPWTHGALAMSGWIRDSGGTPQKRVVELMVYPMGLRIARTVSDPTNFGNNYFFNGLSALDAGLYYTLEVHDPDQAKTPRIKDFRVPV